MPRVYSVEKWILRLRTELVWSLDEEGHDGNDIAQLFNMEKSWIGRIIKQKPKSFKSLLTKVVE